MLQYKVVMATHRIEDIRRAEKAFKATKHYGGSAGVFEPKNFQGQLNGPAAQGWEVVSSLFECHKLWYGRRDSLRLAPQSHGLIGPIVVTTVPSPNATPRLMALCDKPFAVYLTRVELHLMPLLGFRPGDVFPLEGQKYQVDLRPLTQQVHNLLVLQGIQYRLLRSVHFSVPPLEPPGTLR